MTVITNGELQSAGDAAPQMRWAGQRIDAIAPGTLPGLARVSNLVRSVRSPEFQGVTFHEILANSALNHVPADAHTLPNEWTINPFRGCTHACAYCYARPTHDYLGFNITSDFETEIIVKTNIVEVLRAELKKKRKLPPRVALGTSTDPYQRAEGRYQLMPGIIQALGEYRVPFSVLTKGTLIRRDIPLLVDADRRGHVEPGVSISIFDDELQQLLEPGTPTTTVRLKTVREIRDAGLDCTVFIAPILPMLSDRPAQLERMVSAIAEAGATSVLYNSLFLTKQVKPGFFAWLKLHHPRLVPEYTRLFRQGSNADDRYRSWLDGELAALFAKYGLPNPDVGVENKFGLNGRPAQSPAASSAPTLF